MSNNTVTKEQVISELEATELDVLTSFTLADAIRLGSTVTTQAYAWGSQGEACALSAARLAAEATGYLPRS